ncbi:MAG: SCO family protein [Burkholderiales bacterium]
MKVSATAVGVTALAALILGVIAASRLGEWASEPAAPQGAAFSLIDHTGKRVSDRDFGSRYKLIFFGFTHCPDICPTTLYNVAQVMGLLGKEGARVVPLFITVDPQRDTPAVLAQYVTQFHPSIVGLSGSKEEIRRVADGYHVYFAEVKSEQGDDYLMDHTASTFLVAPDGGYRAIFVPGTPADAMAAAIRRHIETH